MRTLFAIAAAILLPIFALAAAPPTVIDATIYTKDGEVPLKLEVAATPQARIDGLMGRETLQPHDGMIFLFPKPHDYSFWMKNTPIPLDMLFVSAKQKVVHIERDVPPYSTAERKSGRDVTAVIELDGGRAARESIWVWDCVRYELPESLEIR